MPTTVKSSAKYAKLGDLSTYSVSTSAIPVDTSDSSGSIPTVNTTFVDGTDVENAIAEDFTISNPGIGTYSGEIVAIGKSANSNRHTLDVHNIMQRLNSTHRLYPLSDFGVNNGDSTYIPIYVLEYWTQQCGIFYSAMPGDTLFYQSQYGHYGAYAKDITRPLKSSLFKYSGTETFGPDIHLGRIYNRLPRDSEAFLTFPSKQALSDMGSLLPVLIPSATTNEQMVFGASVRIAGGRQGYISWEMQDAKGFKRNLQVMFDATNGFSIRTSNDGKTYVTRANVLASAGSYTFNVGVSTVGTSTKFQIKVLTSDGALHGTAETTVALSPIRDSMALQQVVYGASNVGSGTNMLYADVHVSLMKSLPDTLPVPQKSLTPGVKASAFMVGFSGNVWEHIKQYASIYHLDVNFRDGKLTVEPRPKDVKTGASLSELSTRIADREKARNVEVVNYQHKPTSIYPQVMWKADSVYQVAVGEVQEFTVQTDHSIFSLSQPICVTGISPFPYTSGTGQYVVTGSDGYIVSPQFWQDQGGSITCDITENEGEIKVRIKGPDFDSTRAPYRISEGDAGRPALYITGQGVLSDPKTMKIPTGNSKASKDVGVTIDSPFIGREISVYNAAARAAKSFATPDTVITFAEPTEYDGVSKLGTVPAGTLVKADGRVVRVTDATQTPSTVSGSATMHNTIYQLKRSFGAGATIADMNAYYAGKPIGKVNLKPLKVVK